MKEQDIKRLAEEILTASPKTITQQAIIHSKEKEGIQEVRISRHFANVNGQYTYLALVDGKFCTAILNCFVGLYYVDDIYGVVKPK